MKNAPTTVAVLFAGTTAAFTQAYAQDAAEADTDGDGFVSPTELQTLYADLSVGELAAGFEQVDIDGDGLLNDDEIALARESGIFPPAG
jgi:hypothetical protein